MAAPHDIDVSIVGAGPVGTFLALRLALSGLRVALLEALSDFPKSPRAVAHLPVLFPEFKKVGILEQLRGFSTVHSGSVSYRDGSGDLIHRIPPSSNRPGPLAVPQWDFTQILLRHMERFPHAELFLGHRVTQIDDSLEEGVMLTAVTENGEKRWFKSKFAVGADGGRSFVRGAMGVTYEGMTLPFKLLAADVFYPFEKYGFDGANFMCDPIDYGNIAEIQEIDGERIWRIGCGFPDTMSDDEIMDAIPSKFAAMFPGPKPPQYRLLRAQPYEARQLCVPTMRRGRLILVGDAAHLCNPYSGQLLADGIFDVSSLSSVLAAVLHRNAPEVLLDEWSTDRLKKFHEVMDPLSQACFASLRHPDPKSIADRHPFLKAWMARSGAGQMPSLETKVERLLGWVPDDEALDGEACDIQLIWSKP